MEENRFILQDILHLGIPVAERPVRALKFNGFGLGIWRWPLLNILLGLRGTSGAGEKRGLAPTMANEERWTWTDSKGRKRELVIHREVKE